MTQRILITGGAGFIGSNLTDHFLKKGSEVIVFDNLSRKNVDKNLDWLRKKHKKGLTFVKADVRDYNSLLNVCKDVNMIFHTAAQTTVTNSIKDPKEDFEINALGTLNVLEAARQSNTNPIIIYTSTNKVYGNNVNKIPLVEKKTRYEFADSKFKSGIPEDFSTDADAHTPYGCSKYMGDLYMRDFHDIFGLKTVTFRMSCIFGHRQFGSEGQGWIAHFITSSILNRPLTIFGDGKQVRDILFIDDLIRVFELVMEKIKETKGKGFNIGGGPMNTISLLELLSLLESFGLKPKYSFDDWRPTDQKVYISDIRRASEFGWKPQISPKEGIQRLYNWISENRKFFN